MCGICAYIGSRDPVEAVIRGLKRLEYRGYDSAGIGGVDAKQNLAVCKVIGKVSDLEEELKKNPLRLSVAIGHTRWATHGKVSASNAHPQVDAHETLALVHNGIIENHESLKKLLKGKEVEFRSDTDTEVIAHLIGHFYQGDLLAALERTIPLLQGSFSIAMVHSGKPDQIIAVAHESPLAIGIGEGENWIASDPVAFGRDIRQVIYLHSSEIAIVRRDEVETFDASMNRIIKSREWIESSREEVSKEGFSHYTLKEIFEQPQTIRSAMASRFLKGRGMACFESLTLTPQDLAHVKRIVILGCGTSLYAGEIARYMIEEMAGIPVSVEIASEYRNKHAIVPPDTLAIAISQSGETADTLAAMREVKSKGAHVVAICNTHHSTLAREADSVIYLRAGPEIGVCSTKAFTSQLTVLTLLSLLFGRMREMDLEEGEAFIEALCRIPDQIQTVLDQSGVIQKVAKEYAVYNDFFFVGRHFMYPTALEGALKLKELSYVNASGYPAGELKHGVIALIHDAYPTLALCANQRSYSKILSNLREIQAREGKIIAIAFEESPEIEALAERTLFIPRTIDALAPILTAVVLQLFAYYVALERGASIDQPRNLAKAVTVE